MGDAALVVAVQHREMRMEPGRNVIGIQDRDFGSARQAFASHHQNIDVGDCQDRCRADLARKSFTSTSPLVSQATTTTSIPAMLAEAGLVPWAEEGMRHTLRCGSPRAV